jgi:predicted CoA-binding protein
MDLSNFSDPAIIEDILKNYHIVAVVGLSDKPDRPSYHVAAYLKKVGYEIIPINPNADNILGEKSYPDLLSVPEKIDIVDVFRKSETVGPIVDEAIKIKAKAIWFQEGIINEDAAVKANRAGLKVVMDRCMLKEHSKMEH